MNSKKPTPLPVVLILHLAVLTFGLAAVEPGHSAQQRAELAVQEYPERELSEREREVGELQQARAEALRRLEGIANAAESLPTAIEQFKREPSNLNAVRLLEAMSAPVAVGVRECPRIAEVCERAAGINRRVASRVEDALLALNKTLDQRGAHQQKIARLHEDGLAALEQLRVEAINKGWTNDAQLTPTDAARVRSVLIVLRESELAERFGRWSTTEQQRAVAALERTKTRLLRDAMAFEGAAESYRSFGRSFQGLAGNLSDVATAIESASAFSAALQKSGELAERLAGGEAGIEALLDGAVLPAFTDAEAGHEKANGSGGLLRRLNYWWEKLKMKLGGSRE